MPKPAIHGIWQKGHDMLKTITVKGADGNDVQVPMRADASVPRLYRIKFRRDIFKDLGALDSRIEKAKTEGEQLSAFDLDMFENVAYILAKHADKSVPESPDEWLEQFSMFSITEILPEILELWGFNMKTTSIPKKKSGQRSGK
jgi:hypothetical protein